MIRTFGCAGTEDLFDGRHTKVARQILPGELWRVAFRKLDYLNRARKIEVLRFLPGNRLKALHGKWEDYWSIRINDQYRVVFQWRDNDSWDVRIVDYH